MSERGANSNRFSISEIDSLLHEIASDFLVLVPEEDVTPSVEGQEEAPPQRVPLVDIDHTNSTASILLDTIHYDLHIDSSVDPNPQATLTYAVNNNKYDYDHLRIVVNPFLMELYKESRRKPIPHLTLVTDHPEKYDLSEIRPEWEMFQMRELMTDPSCKEIHYSISRNTSQEGEDMQSEFEYRFLKNLSGEGKPKEQIVLTAPFTLSLVDLILPRNAKWEKRTQEEDVAVLTDTFNDVVRKLSDPESS